MSVSIVIPTRNRPTLLLEAVASALEECPEDGALIVVDDGSEVTASEVLNGFKDTRLTILKQAPGRGAAAARNRGVDASLSDMVFFLDDDDLFVPGYISRVLALQVDHPSAEYGFSGVISGGHDDHQLVPWRQHLKRMIAPTSAGFWVRKSAFDRIGGFDESQWVDEDTDLCVRFVAAGSRPLVLRDVGTYVRQLSIPKAVAGAQLTKATAPDVTATCYRRTYEKSSGCFPAFGKERWYLATRYIRRAIKSGFGKEAFQFSRTQRPWFFSMALQIYWLTKICRHASGYSYE